MYGRTSEKEDSTDCYYCLVISLVPVVLKVVLAVIPAVLGGAMIYVCMERIKEIDGGEEDDLSKY